MIGKLSKKIFWWLLVNEWLPDWILRWKIRQSLFNDMIYKMGLEESDYETRVKIEDDFVEEIKEMPIAINQDDANEQHYEVPASFFQIVLGPKLKYSCSIFDDQRTTLSQVRVELFWAFRMYTFANMEEHLLGRRQYA